MRITGRVRQLERSLKPGECNVCGDRSIGLVYDPPHPDGLPVTIGGAVSPPVPCAACGRWPRIVLLMPPTTADPGPGR